MKKTLLFGDFFIAKLLKIAKKNVIIIEYR